MDLSKPWTSDLLGLYADQTTSNQHSHPATISYFQQQLPSLILVIEWRSKNTIAVLGQWMVSILFLRQTAARNLLCWPLCCLVGLQIIKRKHSSSVDVDLIKMLCKRSCWQSVKLNFFFNKSWFHRARNWHLLLHDSHQVLPKRTYQLTTKGVLILASKFTKWSLTVL